MAYMLHALGITGSERVLEIGTGTGYTPHSCASDSATTR